jgi:hypothetical protein
VIAATAEQMNNLRHETIELISQQLTLVPKQNKKLKLRELHQV